MRFKMPLAAAALAVATLGLPAVSSAATLTGAPQSTQSLSQSSTMTESIQWRREGGWGRGDRWGGGGGGWGRCRAWRHECADRWGWGGPGFRRCLWRHGC